MNNINWKVRVKNPSFWLTMVPALALLIQTFLAIFGITSDFKEVTNRTLAFVNALFAVFMIAGVVNDPTTTGITDSTQALGYDKPNWK